MKLARILMLAGAAYCGACPFDSVRCFGAAADEIDCLVENGKIYVTGTAKIRSPYSVSNSKDRLMARRAAIVDGYRKLVKIFYAPAEPKGRGFYFNANGFICSVECVETVYLKDGTVQAVLSMPVKCEKRVCKRMGINVYNDNPVLRERKSVPIYGKKEEKRNFSINSRR